MSLRDAQGRYVQIDDPRIKPLFDRLEHDGRVVLGHQAEPLNCWLPLDRMTVRGDRDYFTEHPQYYMYRHPEMPSHEALLAARDHMLAEHPKLAFDSVHLASLEWDVDKIAEFLDRFPNASVDMAARISHLEHQSLKGRDGVRRFFLRYQDRIMYGTDIALLPADDEKAVAREFHDAWLADWRFLATSAEQHSTEFDGTYRGLGLPRDVVDKVYFANASRLFHAWGAESK
jgi:predicted TIM-barrel fold metal-dependent hydrolase